jgi:hypothetical protein
MGSYGIKDIKFIYYKKEGNEIYLETSSQGPLDMQYLNDYSSEQVIILHSLTVKDTINPTKFYRTLITDISQINDISFSTLSTILKEYSNGEKRTNESAKTSLKDRAIIQNTMDVFMGDIKTSANAEHFQHSLHRLNAYLYSKNIIDTIDSSESITEDKQKEKLRFIQYFLDSNIEPFLQRDVSCKGQNINIKFYLLLCITYHEFSLLRRMENTIDMRKNKKRYINYIYRILSKEEEIITSKHIIKYLKTQNDRLDPTHLSSQDILELKYLIEILNNRPEYYSHKIAAAMKEMFGESHRPLNRFLKLLGFKSIGNSTEL